MRCLRKYEVLVFEKNYDLDAFYVDAIVESRGTSYFSKELASFYVHRLQVSEFVRSLFLIKIEYLGSA